MKIHIHKYDKRTKAYCCKKQFDQEGRQQERKKETNDLQNSQKIVNKMTILSPYLSMVTLNINGLNSPMQND